MDMQKVGAFLAELRREKNLTQDELGERIGVTNKTVSRWENGNYLPPVEMLQILSEFYGVSINEILSGERLNDSNYKEKAEENILTALNNSTATYRERQKYYKKKWLKGHWIEFVIAMTVIIALLICGVIFDNALGMFGTIVCISYSFLANERMNEYISQNIFTELTENDKKN